MTQRHRTRRALLMALRSELSFCGNIIPSNPADVSSIVKNARDSEWDIREIANILETLALDPLELAWEDWDDYVRARPEHFRRRGISIPEPRE